MQNSMDLMMLHDMKRDDTTYRVSFSYACMWRLWMRMRCCQYFIPKAWADIDGYDRPVISHEIQLSKE